MLLFCVMSLTMFVNPSPAIRMTEFSISWENTVDKILTEVSL